MTSLLWIALFPLPATGPTLLWLDPAQAVDLRVLTLAGHGSGVVAIGWGGSVVSGTVASRSTLLDLGQIDGDRPGVGVETVGIEDRGNELGLLLALVICDVE